MHRAMRVPAGRTRPDTSRCAHVAPFAEMRRKSWIVFAVALVATPAHAQEQAEPAPVTVRVESTPRGATVEVLGRGEVGRTPIRRLSIAPGEHDFVFTHRGYARTVQHVSITEDGQTIAVTLARPATISVRAENLPARGAQIRVDGQPAGTVPGRVEVAPGRRLVEVTQDGYLTFGRWVELEAGQTETVNVRLEERPSDVGSILVVTDVEDAEVTVDGEARGQTPRLVEGLQPGEHRVVVAAPTGATVERTVEVRADAREIVSVELASEPPPPGRVAVSSEPPGATVLVDGEPRGTTPAVIDPLNPGSHMMELSLEGFLNEQRVVTIEPGARAELSVELQRGEPRAGRIVVRASREDAFVVIDGASRGRAPISLEHVRPGRHEVRLVAEGAAPYETECVITYGETCTVEGTLGPAPITISVQATVEGEPAEGARLFVDGEEMGALPWEGTLAPGQHELEARADGLVTARRRLAVAPGMQPSIALVLDRPPPPDPAPVEPPQEEPEEPTPAAGPRPFVPRSGAEALASGSGMASFHLGWPYLFGAALQVGLPGPLDVQVAARTYGRLTELEIASRVGVRLADIVALGAVLRIDTGFGPDDVDAVMGRLDARVTLFPIEDLAFTAWLGLDLSSDRYPYVETDDSMLLVRAPRQELARGRVGGAVSWRFASEWSIELLLEGIFASSGGTRRIYGDVLQLSNPDTQLYGEIAAAYQW